MSEPVYILGAGMHAVAAKEELKMKSNPAMKMEGMSKEEMKELGVTDTIPRDAEEALDEMEKDEAIKEALGALCFDRYLDLKRREYKKACQMSTEERRLQLLENI